MGAGREVPDMRMAATKVLLAQPMEKPEVGVSGEMQDVLAAIEWRLNHYGPLDAEPFQYSRYESRAHAVLAAVEESDWLAARVASAAADEREGWASWLEGWLSAVGPEPPTVEAVLGWLRADSRPWGVSAALSVPTAGWVANAEYQSLSDRGRRMYDLLRSRGDTHDAAYDRAFEDFGPEVGSGCERENKS